MPVDDEASVRSARTVSKVGASERRRGGYGGRESTGVTGTGSRWKR